MLTTNKTAVPINSSRLTVDPKGTLWFSSLFSDDERIESRHYSCFSYSSFRKKRTRVKQLQLTVMPTMSMSNLRKPEIQYVSDKNTVALRGSTVSLWCIVGGTPLPTIKWSKKGEILPYRKLEYLNYGKTLKIKDVDFADEGTFECTAFNGVGSPVSHSVMLSVFAAPNFTVQPEIQNVFEGETVEFKCDAEGKPPPEIKWIHNGRPLEETEENPRRKVLKGKIVIENVRKMDTGNYGCNASNSFGYVYKDVYVKVTAFERAEIREKPTDVVTVDGKSVTLTCRAFGVPPPEVRWLKDNQELTGGRYIPLENGDLKIRNVTFADAGEHTCHARNKVGNDSARGTLVVKERTKILENPKDLVVIAGESATFHCNVQSDPTLTLAIYWLSDGVKIDFEAGSRYIKLDDYSLRIYNSTELDSGVYTCLAKTEYDNVTASATLTILNVPNVPVILSVDCGNESAYIRWSSTGDNNSPILAYQLQYNTSYELETWITDGAYDDLPGNATKYTVEMHPWAIYTFRVMAKNSIGWSAPSLHSKVCATPPNVPLKNPDNVEGYGYSPTNLVVFWTPISERLLGGPQFRYAVQWILDDNSSIWQTQQVFDWRASQLEIENVQTYKPYKIRVQSVNKLGSSIQPTKEMIGYSGMGEPTEWPKNLSLVKMINGKSAIFSWNPVNPDSVNGKFEGYEIQSWSDPEKLSDPAKTWVRYDVTEAVVDKLKPFSINYLAILAYNSEYFGPISSVIQVMTEEDRPGPVESFHAYPLGTNALYLVWNKPTEANGILTGYKIYFQTIVDGLLGHLQEMVPKVTDPEITRVKLTGLSTAQNYSVHVRATTSKGAGSAVFAKATTSNAVAPSIVEKPYFEWAQNRDNLTEDFGSVSIRIEWLPNVYGEASAGSHFFVQFNQFNDTKFESTAPEFNTLTSTVSGLRANETYELKVVSVDGDAQNISDASYIHVHQFNDTFFYAMSLPPIISLHSINQTVKLGEVVTVDCAVFGNKPLSVNWLTGDHINLPSTAMINGAKLVFHNSTISDSGIYICKATNDGGTSEAIAEIHVNATELPASPPHFLATLAQSRREIAVALGQTVEIKCNISANSSVSWFRVGDTLQRTYLIFGAILTIPHVQMNDSGVYHCGTEQEMETIDLFVQATSPPLITIQPQKREMWFHVKQCQEDIEKPFILECKAEGDPSPEYKWIKDGSELDPSAHDGRIVKKKGNGTLLFNSPKSEDSGQYQCLAINKWGSASTNTITLRKAELKSFKDKESMETVTAQVGEPFGLACASPGGWPKPRIYWVKQHSDGALETINSPRHTVDPEGTLWFSNVTNDDINSTLVYTCAAFSELTQETTFGHRLSLTSPSAAITNKSSGRKPVVQYVSKNHTMTSYGATVRLWCIIGGTPLPKIVWRKNGAHLPHGMVEYENYGKTLKIKSVDVSDQGLYECFWKYVDSDGVQLNGSHSMQISLFTVPSFTVEPQLQYPNKGETVEIRCEAVGRPTPNITWTQNGKPLQAEAQDNPRRSVLENKIVIENVTTLDTGNYGCNASNMFGYIYKDVFINVLSPPEKLSKPPKDTTQFLIITISSATAGAFALATVGLFIIIRRYRNGLLNSRDIDTFLHGDASADVKDNAYKVPYDKKRYVIPSKSFSLEKEGTLGAGEFGWVCKGTIKIGCEQVVVAVKMANPQKIKPTTINGLLSEIKVLAYVGKHDNITELMGANVANVKVGRVYIFLEMCPNGSLEKYLRKLRPVQEDCQSVDQPGAQYSNIMEMKALGSGKTTPLDPSLSQDLYRWSKEICDGMAFLASKQVVHADLATRNVLLGRNKEAKICDFGLARRMYNYASYVKSQQEPLPWKWMAPESLRVHEFNEKTDVWAYGITLWEIYSLGDCPYQGLSWDLNFSSRLEGGFRLPEPQFNDRDMYSVMRKCWELSPDARPSFNNLKDQF